MGYVCFCAAPWPDVRSEMKAQSGSPLLTRPLLLSNVVLAARLHRCRTTIDPLLGTLRRLSNGVTHFGICSRRTGFSQNLDALRESVSYLGLRGKNVADLGCGFGWASRWMREQGAASVLGFDVAQNMIARAKADTADDAIVYRIADLETLELPGAGFDLVYSALAFHYVEDFGRLVRMIYGALVDGGDLVFTIEHPIFMAAARPRWIADHDGRKTWPVNG